jgi:hypothetical protein
MSKAFVIYGCPYTAFELTRNGDFLVVPEPDRYLYHFRRNVNRLSNLVGFSGLKDIRLVGCSSQFINEFTAHVASRPEAGFRLSQEQENYTEFREDIVANPGSNDVIVVEKRPSLFPIANQLARMGNARVVAIDPLSDAEADAFSTGQKDFEQGSGLARDNGLSACCSLIKARLGASFFASPCSSVTFLTKFPYNLYPFACPTGHLSPNRAGELVVAGLLKAQSTTLQTGVAVVLDSGDTQAATDSEYGAIRAALHQNYGVLPATKGATLGDFWYFVQHIPADLVFLTAHCGHMALRELETTFTYKGRLGRVRYAVDRGISSVPSSGLVGCQTNYLPIEVNGVDWESPGCERSLFLEFSKVEMDVSLGAKSQNPDFADLTIREVENPRSRNFPMKCLRASDGQHFVPLMNTVGGYYFPLVFNNACASYSGVCGEFLPDVSFYVGTTRPIDSFSAVEVVTQFVKNLSCLPVGKALFEAQRGFIHSYTPYLLAGVPWLTVPKYAASAAIMKANSLLKHLGRMNTGNDRADHQRRLFQEQQRKVLLKQLFDAGHHQHT